MGWAGRGLGNGSARAPGSRPGCLGSSPRPALTPVCLPRSERRAPHLEGGMGRKGPPGADAYQALGTGPGTQ
ncbi:unnamed protein product [Gulo gulo]|uniref:Uncharacterized protein n=1 Tax=Gulo gulo TaxID=48420 RepID=A0A9X9LNM9_GULGU|nr:unnamed protein product [Gulo gulo]